MKVALALALVLFALPVLAQQERCAYTPQPLIYDDANLSILQRSVPITAQIDVGIEEACPSSLALVFSLTNSLQNQDVQSSEFTCSYSVTDNSYGVEDVLVNLVQNTTVECRDTILMVFDRVPESMQDDSHMQVWSQANPGELVVFEANDRLTEIAASNETQSAQVVLLNESPANVPEIAEDRKVYRFIEIESHVEEVSEARISFTVEQQWLEMNEVAAGDVSLIRLSEGRWNELPTRMVSEDDQVVTFEAVSPGLSLFAIVATVPAQNETDSNAENASVQVPRMDGDFDEDEVILLTALLILLIAIGGLVALALARRRSVREETRRGGTARRTY